MEDKANNLKRKIKLSLGLIAMVLMLSGCTPSIDLTQMAITLQKNLPNVVRLIIAVSYIMGLWMMYSGLYTLKLYGDARTMMSSNTSFGPPMFRLLLGTVLLLMPGMIKIAIYSLWGTKTSILDYPDWGSGLASWKPVLNAAIAIIRIFGYIAFLRGFILINKATRQGAQPGLYGKGTLHVVGGILAINIVGTIDIIKHSFGFG